MSMEFHNQNGISGQMKNTGKKNKIAGSNQQSFLSFIEPPYQTGLIVPAALFSPFLLADASVPVLLSSLDPAIYLHGAGLCCIFLQALISVLQQFLFQAPDCGLP